MPCPSIFPLRDSPAYLRPSGQVITPVPSGRSAESPKTESRISGWGYGGGGKKRWRVETMPSAPCCNDATPPSTLHSNLSSMAGIASDTSAGEGGEKRRHTECSFYEYDRQHAQLSKAFYRPGEVSDQVSGAISRFLGLPGGKPRRVRACVTFWFWRPLSPSSSAKLREDRSTLMPLQ